jgi:hypothetical protein
MRFMRGHWRRLMIQAAILLSMIVVNFIDDQIFTMMVSASLIVIPVVTWTIAAFLLWMSSKAPDIETLAERADDALTAAISSTVAAFVAAIVILRLLGIITGPIASYISVGISFVVVTSSLPSLAQSRVAIRVWLPMLRARGALPGDDDRQDPTAA